MGRHGVTVLALVVVLAGLAFPVRAAGDLRPGTVLRVDATALPSPYAGVSVANSPEKVARTAAMTPHVADGWQVSLFASALLHARWLAVAPDGAVLVSESAAGRVTILRDGNHDGEAEEQQVLAEGLVRPHGLAFAHGGVYIADTRAVWFAPYPVETLPVSLHQVTPDGALGGGDGHWTRTLAVSPDQKTLYVAIGSRSNISEDPLPRASVQAFTLSEDGRKVRDQQTWASGLRNPVGLAFQPGTGHLWTVVNERDGLGDGLVPDYLARLEEGSFFGWPYSYIGPHPQPDLPAVRRPAPEVAALIARAVVPPLLFASHSAPLGLVFDRSGDAIVALHGSWNADAPRGYMVVRVPFRDGAPVGDYQVLVSGFRLGNSPDGAARVWGRPVGLAWAADGALLVSDDVGQTIWRVSRKDGGTVGGKAGR
ncbi:PQQ-dependent sugar dehydrogenase [Insolitispirillum peregrinum]|uniref:PQQ-dependent sugar dehydrogenase n=1 Tax=Insolitispirillum peregrinum TaxID=80876 RepID=UPI00360A7360